MRRPPILAAILLALLAAPAAAQTLRVATFNAELARDGPGVLLHELRTKPKERALSAVAVIKAVRPDVLVLQRIDHDMRGHALAAFAQLLAAGEDGIDYPYSFHAPVNAGVPSGLDLDGDGLVMGTGDALGWGRYPGNGGMAVLSRLPIDAEAARSFRGALWRDQPDARLPARADGAPYFPPEALDVVPLSSRAHWEAPVILPDGRRLALLTAHPTPPLFDGPERLNVLRNRDEVLFWARYLDGAELADDQGRVATAPGGPLVVLGDFNLDPLDGAGDGAAMARLLDHPRLQNPSPASMGAEAAARDQGGANARHRGAAALDTADWRDEPGPGNLRVSYVLPSRDLEVVGAGVFWPAPDDPQAALLDGAGPHRLVWVDLRLGP